MAFDDTRTEKVYQHGVTSHHFAVIAIVKQFACRRARISAFSSFINATSTRDFSFSLSHEFLTMPKCTSPPSAERKKPRKRVIMSFHSLLRNTLLVYHDESEEQVRCTPRLRFAFALLAELEDWIVENAAHERFLVPDLTESKHFFRLCRLTTAKLARLSWNPRRAALTMRDLNASNERSLPSVSDRLSTSVWPFDMFYAKPN
jgi:hypothetical protein